MISIPYYETSNFVFSNFSAHTVKFNGLIYPTVEHAFHAQKFSDPKLREKIIRADSPLVAWQMARKLKAERREDWNSVKIEILKVIIREKINQHTEVRDALIATGTEDIIEQNPNDDFWGSGANGNGQNNTGKILMELRSELTNAAP